MARHRRGWGPIGANAFGLLAEAALLWSLANPACSCPWHALVGKNADDLGPEADARRVLVVQQIDRMTSKETIWAHPGQVIAMPARYGITCTATPTATGAAASTAAAGVEVVCTQHGKETKIERSCRDADARTVKGWDAYDRMGVNILSVLVVCVPPELIPPGM